MVELLPLVRKIALRMKVYLPAHVELDDLVGAGVLGLVDAVGKFDSTRQVKIESYARHRIRGAILDSLRELDSASRDLRKKSRKAEAVQHQVESRLGRAATEEEIAGELGISLAEWHRTTQKLHVAGADWLRRQNSLYSGQVIEEECLPDPSPGPFESCARREQMRLVGRALAALPEREREVVHLYHFGEMTMKEIGAMLRVDESRVSQLRTAALGRLRLTLRQMLSTRPGLSALSGASPVPALVC